MKRKLFQNFYKGYIGKWLPLTDQLAVSRSVLANERTYLSYQRSALTLVVAGFTLIKFFDSLWIIAVGILFLPAAIITFILGTYRYIRMRDLIKNLENESKAPQNNNNQ